MPPRKTALVIGLAGVAGFVDAVGYVVLRGLFTAHMSGNAAQFGVHLGGGDLTAAIPLIIAVAIFVLGCAAGEAISVLARRRAVRSRDAPAVALQALLLAAFMVYGDIQVGSGQVTDHTLGGFYALAALAIVSIGLQAATITQIGGETVRTAYISGVLTNLGQLLARHLLSPDPPHRGRTGLMASIALTYLGAATLGSLLHDTIGIWALAAPLAFLVIVVAEDLRRPLEEEERTGRPSRPAPPIAP